MRQAKNPDYVKDNSTGEKIQRTLSQIDWRFCSLVCQFLSPKSENLEKVVLQHLLLRDHRSKLDRKDYLERTARNAVIKSKEQWQIGSALGKLNIQPLLQKSRPPKALLDSSRCIKIYSDFNIFRLGQPLSYCNTIHPTNRSFNLVVASKKDQNFVKMNVPTCFGIKELDFYCALIEIAKSASLTNLDNNLNYYYYDVSFKSLYQSMNKYSCTRQREQIIRTLNRFSKIQMSYRQEYQTGSSLVMGSCNFLVFEFDLHASENYRGVKIGLNSLAIKILQQSDKHFAILNLSQYFSLKSAHTRILFYHLCLKIKPGNYFNKFTLKELIKDLYEPDPYDDKDPLTYYMSTNYRKRMQRIRETIDKLHNFFNSLPDFQSILITELDQKSSPIIMGIKVKRLMSR